MKKKSIKRILKWVACLTLALGLLLAAQLYAVLHPEHFFDYTEEYGSFKIFSSEPISPEFEKILQEVGKRAENSEIHSSDILTKIVLANDGLYFALAGKSQIPRTIGNCIVLGGKVDIDRNRLILPAVEMNLVYIITHEAVHVGQHEEHGLFMNTFFDFGRHPTWKTEGYAEWISQKNRLGDSTASIYSTLILLKQSDGKSWVDLGDGYTMPASYLRNRIMVEYLLKIDGMEYSDIMDTNISEADLWNEITKAEQGSGGNG